MTSRVANEAWTIAYGGGPVVAVALHAGHDVSKDVAPYLEVTESERLREEDPHSDEVARAFASSVVVHRSRFEVDLNRAREACVYAGPADAWGLSVWKAPLPEELCSRGIAHHERFYGEVADLLSTVAREHRRFVVFDIHTYNHRRQGPDAPPAPQGGNPDVNLGTGELDRASFGSIVRIMSDAIGHGAVRGAAIDVRENVRFLGGYFPAWVNRTYRGQGCAVAIEIKKVFMDEWSGVVDRPALSSIRCALLEAGRAIEAFLSEHAIP